MRRLLSVVLALVTLTACTTPNGSDGARRGQQVFAQHCVSCHSLSPGVVIVGPSLSGIAGRARAADPDSAGRSFLQTSILDPEQIVTEGFQPLMPTDFAQRLSDEDLAALIDFLLTID